MFALNGVAKISIYDANGKFVKDITHMNAVHIYNGNEEYPNVIAIESEVIDEEFESLYHNGIDERTVGKDEKDNMRTVLYACDYCVFGVEKEPFGDITLDSRYITTYTHYISCMSKVKCIIKK